MVCLLVASALICLASVVTAEAASAGAAVVPAAALAQRGPTRGWAEKGPAAAEEEVELIFALKLQNTAELERILERVSDPSSPDYGHYLTKAQADHLTAPRHQDVDIVER
mmetsp:Transcript_26256/g.87026  ORF Transcript_26256/g.87026 Transcript_26256/m.87026 type:complete len:110 (-) Transcript_26256:422-751(-)